MLAAKFILEALLACFGWGAVFAITARGVFHATSALAWKLFGCGIVMSIAAVIVALWNLPTLPESAYTPHEKTVLASFTFFVWLPAVLLPVIAGSLFVRRIEFGTR